MLNEVISEYIDILITSPNIHSLFISSPAGLGKSFTTLEKIKSLGLIEDQHFIYQTGYITPLRFYKLLQRCEILDPPKLLIVDDVDTILNNKISLGLLKCALAEARGKRVIKYESRNDIEREFEFTGKVIIITNSLSDTKALKPVLDRGIVYEFEKDIPALVGYIEEHLDEIYPDLNKKEKICIWEKIKRFINNEKFSLRTLHRAFIFYENKKDKWYDLWVKTIKK